MREIIFKHLLEEYQSGSLLDSIILSNDFGAMNLDPIRAHFPSQFINCGISEQNQVSMSAGIAKMNMLPIVYSIAAFFHRAAEQIKNDVAVPNLPVIFLGVGAGYGYPADGPTHHSIEDIGLFSSFDEFDIIVPSNFQNALRHFKKVTTDRKCPTYFRLDRAVLDMVPAFENDVFFSSPMAKSKNLVVSMGALGAELYEARTGDLFEVCLVEKFSALKDEMILEKILAYENITVVEEHVKFGGLGSHLLNLIDFSRLKMFNHLCLTGRKRYGYETRENLYRKNGVHPQQVIDLIKTLNA